MIKISCHTSFRSFKIKIILLSCVYLRTSPSLASNSLRALLGNNHFFKFRKCFDELSVSLKAKLNCCQLLFLTEVTVEKQKGVRMQ